MDITVRKLMLETDMTEWLCYLIDKYKLDKRKFVYYESLSSDSSGKYDIGEFIGSKHTPGNFMLEFYYNFNKSRLSFQLMNDSEGYLEEKELDIAKYLMSGYIDRLVVHIIDTTYNVLEEKCNIARSHGNED